MRMTLRFPSLLVATLALPVLLATGCNDPEPGPPDMAEAPPDLAEQPDLKPECATAPLPPTAGAGGTVKSGALSAGAAEAYIEIPVGSPLAGYTNRAVPAGDAGNVDRRTFEAASAFNPSVGYETRLHARALALSAGDENVVFLLVDAIFADTAITAEVAKQLGPEYAGKVVFGTTHTHNQLSQYSVNKILQLGQSSFRRKNFDGFVSGMVKAAREAIANKRPAKIGIVREDHFDPQNTVAHDRRGVNDVLTAKLMGVANPEQNPMNRKDDFLSLMRVDGVDGKPIALVTFLGIHGTTLDSDNAIASNDSSGGIERALEEQFDTNVVVMHFQGAGGDVSPGGRGGISRDDEDVAHFNWARCESIGRLAAPMIMDVYQRAGADMKDTLSMEMTTRIIPLGPDHRTFKVREGKPNGPLEYAPFDSSRTPDAKVYDVNGTGTVTCSAPPCKIISPLDEFNAPFGAGLCGEKSVMVPIYEAEIQGCEAVPTYASCTRIEAAAPVFEKLFKLTPFDLPVCSSRHTMISALRIGDWMFAALPGEVVTLLADHTRALSPLGADKTVVIGYAQGHIGYVLTADDWLLGEYEASINIWGPLEGEYVSEQVGKLMEIVKTDAREDGAADGVPFLLPWVESGQDPVPAADPPTTNTGKPAPTIPPELYVRGVADPIFVAQRAAQLPKQAQPDAEVPRLKSARFVWVGEDPMAGTPKVFLQRETSPGTFANVTRRSGRPVVDSDVIVTWTPQPLRRTPPSPGAPPPPRTHYWVAEWQAVVWQGYKDAATPDVTDDLEDRAGVPLGKYRFHIEGTGYALDSNPFTVTPGTVKVTATPAMGSVGLKLAYPIGIKGYRLMDQQVPSNGDVPLRRGPVDVEITFDDMTKTTATGVAVDAQGNATVPFGGSAVPVTIKVTDRYGNTSK